MHMIDKGRPHMWRYELATGFTHSHRWHESTVKAPMPSIGTIIVGSLTVCCIAVEPAEREKNNPHDKRSRECLRSTQRLRVRVRVCALWMMRRP
jgi:hypothetical protein